MINEGREMESIKSRAVLQYQNNPLAKCFVNVICAQLKATFRETDSIVYRALAHDGLLNLLEEVQLSLGRGQLLEIMKPRAIFDKKPCPMLMAHNEDGSPTLGCTCEVSPVK